MVTREQMVEQSVQDFMRESFTAQGYIPDVIDLRDGFPSYDERASTLEKTQVALAFMADPGGRAVELGSDLTMKTHGLEFWTFGISEDEAENVAYTIRAFVEEAEGALIPLKDIGAPGQPVIDQLQLDDERRPVVQRQIATDPRPWDLFVWTTQVRVLDTYYPSAWR